MRTIAQPRVSVVIPTYNMERHIARTIACVVNQTFTALEVLVVDDCSTDRTPEIVKSLAEQDQRIRYLRLTQNSNRPAVPRNVGIAESTGEYVAFLDHDDTWTRNKLTRQISFLDRHPEVDMAHAPLWTHVNGNPLRGITRLPLLTELTTTYRSLLKRNTVMCSSSVVRRSTLETLGGFDEQPTLRTVEDYDLWLRIARVGKIKVQPFVCGSYFFEPSGALSQEDGVARLKALQEKNQVALMLSHADGVRGAIPRALSAPLAAAILGAYSLVDSIQRVIRR